jgi:DNA-binding NarL/FixJ family response regulator
LGNISVIIVEDNLRYAAALAKGLDASEGIRVIGTFYTAEELLKAGPSAEADVAILDIGLPGMDGIALVKKLKYQRSGMELLMLTAFEDEEKLFSALKAGASGYLTKNAAAAAVALAVKELASGGTVISPALARRFCSYFESLGTLPARSDPWGLESDEKELLRFIARGLTNTELGDVLGMGRRSVRTRLGHIYAKMGVNSRVEAVAMAIKAGVIDSGG